jgi:hypothetical protein
MGALTLSAPLIRSRLHLRELCMLYDPDKWYVIDWRELFEGLHSAVRSILFSARSNRTINSIRLICA